MKHLKILLIIILISCSSEYVEPDITGRYVDTLGKEGMILNHIDKFNGNGLVIELTDLTLTIDPAPYENKGTYPYTRIGNKITVYESLGYYILAECYTSIIKIDLEFSGGNLVGTWAYEFYDCSDPSIIDNNGEFEEVLFEKV